MSIQTSDISEIISMLETNTQLRQQFIKALFPEIDIARSFERLTALIERMDARLEAYRNETNQQIGELNTKVSQLDQRMDGFESRMDGFESRMDRFETRQDQMAKDIAGLKGKSQEGYYRDRADSIFGVYLSRGRRASNDIADQLHVALKAKQINLSELKQVLAADLLWSGRLRGTDESIILVMEASWLAQNEDVERAVERAAILRKIGLNAYPVVGGDEWTDEALALAQAQQAIVTTDGQIDHDSWLAVVGE